MEQRPKMELEVNKPTRIKLLFNSCVEGSSKFGKYYLYNILNGDGTTEYSLFAQDQLHEQLKKFKKDDELLVTKLAAQRGNKLVVTWEVEQLNKTNSMVRTNENNLTNEPAPGDDYFYSTMEKIGRASCRERV